MTNNTDKLTDRQGREISQPRDLSKTHKRAYIVSVRNKNTNEDTIFYVKNEWEAEGHLHNDGQQPTLTTYYPCMVSNQLYETIG